MLKQRVNFSILFVIFFLFQFLFFPLVPYRGSTPDIIAILVVFYAFYVRKEKFLVFAFLVGLFKDIFGVAFIGLEALSYFIAGNVIYLLVRKIPIDILLFRVLVTLLFLCVSQITSSILIHLFYYPFNMLEVFWYKQFPSILYTILLAPFLFILTKLIVKETLRQYRLF